MPLFHARLYGGYDKGNNGRLARSKFIGPVPKFGKIFRNRSVAAKFGWRTLIDPQLSPTLLHHSRPSQVLVRYLYKYRYHLSSIPP